MTVDEQRIEDAQGDVFIRDGVVDVRDLRGTHSGATALLNGELRVGPDGADKSWRYELSGLPVEEHASLSMASSTASTTMPASGPADEEMKVSFRGVVDVWGAAHGRSAATESGDLDGQTVAHIVSGTLDSFAVGEPWQVADAWLVMTGDRCRIASLRCQDDQSTVVSTGEFVRRPAIEDLRVDLQATSKSLQGVLPRLVPPRWRPAVEALGLRGVGTLEARIGKETQETPLARFLIQAAEMRPAPLPIELRDIRGEVELTADGFELRAVHARGFDGGEYRMVGRGGWGAGGEAVLTIDAADVPILAVAPASVCRCPSGSRHRERRQRVPRKSLAQAKDLAVLTARCPGGERLASRLSSSRRAPRRPAVPTACGAEPRWAGQTKGPRRLDRAAGPESVAGRWQPAVNSLAGPASVGLLEPGPKISENPPESAESDRLVQHPTDDSG